MPSLFLIYSYWDTFLKTEADIAYFHFRRDGKGQWLWMLFIYSATWTWTQYSSRCSMWKESLIFWALQVSSKFEVRYNFIHTHFYFSFVYLKLVVPKISLDNQFLSRNRSLLRHNWNLINFYIPNMAPQVHFGDNLC